MPVPEGITYDPTRIYEHFNTARNYLRRLDDFYAKAASAHNTTFEHYLVLLAVHCLGDSLLPLRALAEHLVRDRTATGQLCKRMQQLGLLELTYESNSHRPQLMVSLNDHGRRVLAAITDDAMKNRNQYLRSLPTDKRTNLAVAVRLWLEGLDSSAPESISHSIL